MSLLLEVQHESCVSLITCYNFFLVFSPKSTIRQRYVQNNPFI
jgi:hypothetical protein